MGPMAGGIAAEKRPNRWVALLVTIRKYDPAAVPAGTAATIAVSDALTTVRLVPARLTTGVPVPKPVPLMVIWVPAGLSSTSLMTGRMDSWADAATGTASRRQRVRRVNIVAP
jgi:hypothetical protein